MPHARINGIDLYYEVLGAESPLLFLGGSGSTIEDWLPLVGEFARNFRVAVADSRGLGRSEVPADAYAMADLAADVIGLAGHLTWNTFSLVGVSFGGMVAQEVAVTIPQRIRRLVLMCTSAGGAGGSSYPLHELGGLDPDERAGRVALLGDTRFTPEWLADHPREQALLEAMSSRPATEPTADAVRGAELQLQARTGHDVFDRLPRITCPTLIAAGRFDGIAPPANSAAIAARIPGAELRVYDGGHDFFTQDATAVPDLLGFMTESGPA